MMLLLRALLTTFVVVALCLSAGCRKGAKDIAPTDLQIVDAGGGWYDVSSKKGGFKAIMPGQPTIQTNVVASPGGSLDQYLLACELSGTVAFAILYNVFDGSDQRRLLADACRGVSRDAKVITERDVTLSGIPGREMIMEKMGGTALVSARVYARGEVVYLVSAVVPQKKGRAEAVTKFLEAFTFLN